MKKILFLCVMVLSHVAFAAATTGPKIGFQLDLGTDIEEYGLKPQNLQTELISKIARAGIDIQDESNNPKLVLRIRTIQAGSYIVSFVHLGFSEPAELIRNHAKIMALTSSRANLIAASHDDFVSTITQASQSMLDTFIGEYKKAFVTQDTVQEVK